jgi:hypothetical protein
LPPLLFNKIHKIYNGPPRVALKKTNNYPTTLSIPKLITLHKPPKYIPP